MIVLCVIGLPSCSTLYTALSYSKDTSWRARESAILALGAVADGCEQGLLPYLSDMIAMMLPKMVDPRPMVRIISCWSLTRYSHWLLEGELVRRILGDGHFKGQA